MASIGEMIQEIKEDASRQGAIYGFVFSLAYCSVVRLDNDDGGYVAFQHTPVLQFLASQHGSVRSTPGMIVLVCLMANLSTTSVLESASEVLQSLCSSTDFNDPLYHTILETILSKLPIEICMEITEYLEAPQLVLFSHLSHNGQQAAAYALRYPHIEVKGCYYRLYRDMWRVRPTVRRWGTWEVDLPLRYGLSKKRHILKWLYAHPRDFSTTIFRATTPKLGECFLTIGISTDGTIFTSFQIRVLGAEVGIRNQRVCNEQRVVGRIVILPVCKFFRLN